MPNKLQLGAAILTLAGCVALSAGAWAQKPHNDRPPASHPAQPHPQNHPDANRPPANANRPANTNQGNNRPPGQNNLNNPNRPRSGAGLSPNQPAGANVQRRWVDTMRSLTPQQRERVFQNSPAFQSLSPDKQNKIRQQFNQWDHMSAAQRADLQTKERTWMNMTPEQRDHIKNDIAPKWRQLPWDRQQMMKQKLGVLQNMPESARNQRLNDPNFTKGMSDEEKSMLHDLAHTHVGGPPEPPTE